MYTTVDSAAALNAALKVAHSGDVIQLASGTYSGVLANNLHFATGVTVTEAQGANAVLTSLTVKASSGLTFSGLEFYADPAGAQNPFAVCAGSSDIHFDHVSVHGSLDGNPQNDVQGMIVRDSNNVSITNSEFQQLWTGLSHANMQGLTVAGNTFHDIRQDDVHGGGSSFVTITGNSLSSFYPVAGDHSDAIQFWTSGATVSAHDITISDNLIQRGGGAAAQGVFMSDASGAMPYVNLHVTGNWIIGGLYNGIALSGATSPVISGNYVQGFTDTKSWIRLEYVTGGQVTGDSANSYVTSTTDASVTMSGNATVAQASDGGAGAMALWNSAHPSGLHVAGTSAVDTISGGSGADTLAGGGGVDRLTGGSGDDLYVLASKSTIVEAANGGIDTVQSSVTFTLPTNVENLTLTGTGAISGTGNSANNLLTGNGLANTLSGAAGSDTLIGGAGNDVLKGGAGDDLLIGGAGDDHFVFLKGDGHDVVTDFGLNGDHDVLDISNLLSLGLTPTLTDTASSVVVSFSTGDSIELLGRHAADLHATTAGYIF
jgi:Ca2+-binding RTX toxin-like protein